jgi:hypothetical protein
MNLSELSGQFLIDDEIGAERLGLLLQRLLKFCIVRKDGGVEIVGQGFSGKTLVKMVLSARLVASKLQGSNVSGEVTAEEISQFTGLPKDQVTARSKECVDERFAERTSRGSYKARQHKLDEFLEEVAGRIELGRNG